MKRASHLASGYSAFRVAICVAGIGATLPTGGAVTVYGTLNNGGAPSTLVQIDAVTGALVQTIGSVGYAVNGLEYTSLGKLYGSTSAGDSLFPSGLIEIDPATGVGTPIGSGFNAGGYVDQTVVSLTSDSAGNLYGWWEGSVDSLAAISTVTGEATQVGSSGLGTGTLGLAVDGADNLFLVNYDGTTYAVDRLTGTASFLYDILQMAHHGDFNPEDGRYYGIDMNGSGPKNLVVADLTLGSGSVGTYIPTVDDLHTLTFVVVPEPAEAAVGVGLVILGFVLARRKWRREAGRKSFTPHRP